MLNVLVLISLALALLKELSVSFALSLFFLPLVFFLFLSAFLVGCLLAELKLPADVVETVADSEMVAAGVGFEVVGVKFGLSVVEPAVENPGEEEQDPGSSSLDSGCQQN